MLSETATPILVSSDHATLPSLLRQRLRDAPGHVAFRVHEVGGWRDVSTAEFQARVDELAAGLVASGLTKGDRIAVMSETRYEWALIDFAAWRIGAVVVPIYETASTPQIIDVWDDTEPAAVVIGTIADATTLIERAPDGRCWRMDALDELAALGRTGTYDLDAASAAINPGDIATIVYTSGTQGAPRGALVTHANLVDMALNVAAAYPDVVHDRATTLIFLPMAHILARALQVCAVGAGMRVSHLADVTQVVPTLTEVRPTFLVVVPRVLEKIRAAARAKAATARLGRVFQLAERVAVDAGRAAEASRPRARPLHWVFDKLFYRKIRALMGGRLTHLLSGAAPLGAELSLFFRGMGMPVVEGYGLTETTAPATGNRPGAIRSGTVGTPMPGTSVRISDAGEVLVKGIGVCAGYLDGHDPLIDGFFPTGDLGVLDADGYLTITGRLKDVIVTSGGKNIQPEPWEAAVSAEAGLSATIMIGDGRTYASAILVQAGETPWPGRLVTDSAALASARQAVDSANRRVSRAEQVKRFVLIEADLTSVLTPTQKLRRAAAVAEAPELVETLYA